MSERLLRPFAEGFWGSVHLCKSIILAPLSVISVVAAFVNASRLSDFRANRRSS